MSVSDFVPPLGWIAALTSATATALWLQGSPELHFAAPEDFSPELQNTARDKYVLRLPPLSDAAFAAELFALRPLLSEGRRPFVPEQVTATPEAEPEPPQSTEVPQAAPRVVPEPPLVAMLGIMEADGRQSVLFRDDTSGIETWYLAGEAVAGWTIVEILPDRTRLQLQDAEITFNLFGE